MGREDCWRATARGAGPSCRTSLACRRCLPGPRRLDFRSALCWPDPTRAGVVFF